VRKSVADPVWDARVNILGSIGLLQACTRHGVNKVIYASTGGALYGEGRQLPATEDHPVNPEAPYGASKHTVEHYLYLWKLLHGLDSTVLRYPNVYGPRQNPHGEAGVVAIFLGSLAEGRAPRIFGDGLQTRDYVYAGDVARATLAAGGQVGGVFNVGTGSETSVVELYEACRRVAGSTLDAEPAPARLGELQRSVLDVSRAERELGWQPEVALEDGLRLTWESIAG
jgi:UDP-glucose 4-epimerase